MAVQLFDNGLAVGRLHSKEAIIFSSDDYRKETKRDPERPRGKDDEYSGDVAHWGINNTFPETVLKAIRKNPDLAAGLRFQARALVAGGVGYERLMLNTETGEYEYKPVIDPEIEIFLRRNRAYFHEASYDLYRFFNIFPEVILTVDKSYIYYLSNLNARFCRYARQDDYARLKYMYVSTMFKDGYINVNDRKNVGKRRLIDPLSDEVANLRSMNTGYRFVYPVSYYSGDTYYQLADWDSVRQSKWLELAGRIPAFKTALMKNQVTLKYIVHIPSYYWKWKYKDWEEKKAEERLDLIQTEYDRFMEFMSGDENSGKVFFNSVQYDEINQKEFPGWKIEPINDKQQDSVWIEDSLEATIKIWTALGVDPAIAGISPGKGKLNTAGSNIREALNAYLALQLPAEQAILAPLDLVADFNGWNRKGLLRFYFKKPFMQTLDKVTPSQRETVNPESNANS